MATIHCAHGSEWYAAPVGYLQLTRAKGCWCRPDPAPGMKLKTSNICDEEDDDHGHDETFHPATKDSPKIHWYGEIEKYDTKVRESGPSRTNRIPEDVKPK